MKIEQITITKIIADEGKILKAKEMMVTTMVQR